MNINNNDDKSDVSDGACREEVKVKKMNLNNNDNNSDASGGACREEVKAKRK